MAKGPEPARPDQERLTISGEQPGLGPDVLNILTDRASGSLTRNKADQALRSNYAALAVATAISDQTGIARAWRRIAQCFDRKDDLKDAVDAGEKAAEVSARVGDKQLIADS